MIKQNPKGLTIIELSLVIFILATTIWFSLKVIAPSLKQVSVSKEHIILRQLINAKREEIVANGFWIWDMDTEITVADSHPSTQWKNQLSAKGYTNRATLDVTFLKEESGTLVPFSGPEFDGDAPRTAAEIVITLYNSKGGTLSETVYVQTSPTDKVLWSQLYALRTALLLYAEDNGTYPSTLSGLVPTYIAEIPNDPYTSERQKQTHIEEITDWHYQNNGDTVTLSANSNRDTIFVELP